ncbi:acyl-CoA thioesterase/bile acid-CoA:amino acid N-acyltransferase family protein [Streptomyces jumonjinensis]|uniref:acyl-CoA thioesterase/bile acid-CoA:amino acid N-acyltransferase family protein n=1 Tax=Streptomyces jumonjinensis TaxID=1945 RepID=UPI0037962E62
MKSTGFKGLLGLLVVVMAASGCTEETDRADGPAVIGVDKATALVDEPVRIRITGLRPGEKVTVTSEAEDSGGSLWSGKAAFTADGKGAVDLTRDRPRSGTYRQADGMGLFWSMVPMTGEPEESNFATGDPREHGSYTVRIAARAKGRPAVERELTRSLRAEGVREQRFTVARDKVAGRLFQPPGGKPRRAPVLVFGGSEGGMSTAGEAALLASRGHPALALCYHGCPGLSSSVSDIPMEYFVTAARLLGRESGEGHDRMAVMGTSRGTEPAQYLVQNHPELFRDAIVYAPADQLYGSFPERGHAWTKGGEPLPLKPLPLDRVRGTVLAVAGGEDALWKALPMAESIADKRGESGPHRALLYQDAGHSVSGFPYTPAGTVSVHPLTRETYSLGGAIPADAHARADSWPRVLKLIGR